MPERIEKSIEVKAPIARVWRAIADAGEFGQWFGVKLDGPFTAGQPAGGFITYPGMEHLRMEVQVTRIEEPHLFAYTWHPYAIDPTRDYSAEPPTTVEFRLEEIGTGTRVTVTETGFEKLPPGRMPEAFRMNEGGWAAQMENIRAHVGG